MGNIYILNDRSMPGVENIPLLGLEYIPQNIDFGLYDALVMTSKSAGYALDFFTHEWKNVPTYVIAPKTAQEIQNLGGKVAFIGNSGHGDEFAQELIPLLKGKKVLFAKAEKTLSGLTQTLLKNGIDISENTVYKTKCNELQTSFTLAKNSVIVFSSPSTIECFFKYFTWDKSFQAVVIGKTTAKYLPLGIEFVISKETSLESCIACAKELMDKLKL